MTDKRLLTDEELLNVRAKVPGTTSVIQFAEEVSIGTAKAQLAKADKAHQQEIEEIGEFIINEVEGLGYDLPFSQCKDLIRQALKNRKGEK